MSLSSLPTELLCDIWKCIQLKKDLNALQQINRIFYQTFNSWLYSFDHAYCDSSALLWAAEGNKTQTAQLSLEERAAVPRGINCLQKALMIAVGHNSYAVVRLLITGSTELNLLAALQRAVESGSCEMVKLLKDSGADINAPIDIFGYLLQNASWLGNQEMTKLLINEGADINALGGCFGTALQAASSAGNGNIVGLLLRHNAAVNAEGGYYGTALQAASWTGCISTVKLLLSKGANVRAQGGHYGYAHWAASVGGHKRVQGVLLWRYGCQRFSAMTSRAILTLSVSVQRHRTVCTSRTMGLFGRTACLGVSTFSAML
jgi:hypothetical protein